MTYEQWKDTHRHAHRIEFMRDYDGLPRDAAQAYHVWLLAKYAVERPASDPNGERT